MNANVNVFVRYGERETGLTLMLQPVQLRQRAYVRLAVDVLISLISSLIV